MPRLFFSLQLLFVISVMLIAPVAAVGAEHTEMKTSAPPLCPEIPKDGVPRKTPTPKCTSPDVIFNPANRELFKPMTRAEIKLLIAILQPVMLKGETGYKTGGSGKKQALPSERIGVLTQDVIAILARIHLDETLKRMQSMPNVDKGMIAWGEKAAIGLDFCGEQRYRDFGGDIALAESRTIVLENRAILETLILMPQLPGDGLSMEIP
jgi:hypothetical protein